MGHTDNQIAFCLDGILYDYNTGEKIGDAYKTNWTGFCWADSTACWFYTTIEKGSRTWTISQSPLVNDIAI